MDQLWIGCGSVVDRLWISCGSGVDQAWIGCGSAVDRLWISCGSAVDQLGTDPLATQGAGCTRVCDVPPLTRPAGDVWTRLPSEAPSAVCRVVGGGHSECVGKGGRPQVCVSHHATLATLACRRGLSRIRTQSGHTRSRRMPRAAMRMRAWRQ